MALAVAPSRSLRRFLIAISTEFSDIDEIEEDNGRKGDDQRAVRTSSAEPLQIDSSNANETGSQKVGEFRHEKEAAIIDEDVNSEDARSVGNTKGKITN